MTTTWRTQKPGGDEHAAFYTGYIQEAPGPDVLATLERQGTEFAAFVRGIPEVRGDHRYAPGKWSIKDVVQHLSDAERVFSYRLLRFARKDPANLPGFDENTYVREANAGLRTLAQLADEWAAVRRSSVALIAPLCDEVMARRGSANGHEISVRALTWILAGHVAHHEKVLRERYL